MIPEYKLYHGAVLSELIDVSLKDISIGELKEDGRLASYILDCRVGLYIKHSTKRLKPWQFTITKSNLREIAELFSSIKQVFAVFVCHTDGIVTLSLKELASIVSESDSEQAWIRISRDRGKWYSIHGNNSCGELKKNRGVGAIIEALDKC